MHGLGIFSYRNGSKYEGEFYCDKRHGKGKMTYDNGEVYEGQWKENMVRSEIGDSLIHLLETWTWSS